MATVFGFLPSEAEFPGSAFPEMLQINTSNTPRLVLGFDSSSNETAVWSFIAPQSLTGTLTVEVWYVMASATSGDVDLDVSIEAVSDGDATDLDAVDSFDTVNSQNNTTVPGTAGYPDVVTVTLTNKDSISAGDLCRMKLTRDASSDTAVGDLYLLGLELRDGS